MRQSAVFPYGKDVREYRGEYARQRAVLPHGENARESRMLQSFIGVYLLVLVWQGIGELKHITVFDSLIPISNKQSERR